MEKKHDGADGTALTAHCTNCNIDFSQCCCWCWRPSPNFAQSNHCHHFTSSQPTRPEGKQPREVFVIEVKHWLQSLVILYSSTVMWCENESEQFSAKRFYLKLAKCEQCGQWSERNRENKAIAIKKIVFHGAVFPVFIQGAPRALDLESSGLKGHKNSSYLKLSTPWRL